MENSSEKSQTKEEPINKAQIPEKEISHEQETIFLLYTMFQQIIEKANNFYNQQSQTEKSKSIIMIKSLIDSSFINQFKTWNETIYSCLNGILYYYLGTFNSSNEDQSVCEEPFTKSLKFFNSLPTTIKMRFLNFYQELFNNLGIIYYNRGEIKKGLQHFAKAEQIYKVFLNLSNYNFINDFPLFMQKCSSLNEQNNKNNNDEKNILFSFVVDGGINQKNFEHNYTLTIFYYAQAFTKLGFRKKAIHYCSLTLKRQIEYNEYDLKDAVNNCINISDFYLENQNFAQTEYILFCALSLLPKDLEVKKKLRAAVQAQLGKYYLERLKLALLLKRKNVKIADEENLKKLLNSKKFIIKNLDVKFPEIKDVTTLEEAKTVFRLGNTQLKKALKIFVMDGFVTDHIKISQAISHLYKYLIFFETDNGRIFAMEERRINILEPIYKAINHKVYVMQWQETSLELAEIFCEIFESNYELFRIKQKKMSSKEIDEINEFGKKSIFYYEDIIGYIVNEYGKETEKKFEDFITIITIKSNIARLYSKIIYMDDVKKRVESLKKSFDLYNEVYNLLKGAKDIFGEKEELKENLTMCREMIGMLPIKIDKVNRGEEFY